MREIRVVWQKAQNSGGTAVSSYNILVILSDLSSTQEILLTEAEAGALCNNLNIELSKTNLFSR